MYIQNPTTHETRSRFESHRTEPCTAPRRLSGSTTLGDLTDEAREKKGGTREKTHRSDRFVPNQPPHHRVSDGQFDHVLLHEMDAIRKKSGLVPSNSRTLSFSVTAARGPPKSRNRRQVWRRRKLTKKDEFMEAKLERVPFLEEQVRKMNEGGGLLAGDIDRLMKSEDNRFEFVNDIAAEAKSYVEKNRDEYGAKKPILHVISNRMNEAGFARAEAYMETDPYLPGSDYLKIEWT